MKKVSVVCLLTGCFALGMAGCGGETEKDKNPNPSLGDINTKELPKRDGVKGSKDGKGPQKK